jgi:hypothetical protein
VAKKAVTVTVDEKVIFTDLLKDNLEGFIKECDDAIEEIEYQKRKIIKNVFPEFDWTYQLTSWHWKCEESPANMCIYDLVEDRARDNCIFCGQPEERK